MHNDYMYSEDYCDEYWNRLARALGRNRYIVTNSTTIYRRLEEEGKPVGKRNDSGLATRSTGQFNYIDRPFKGRNLH